MFLLFLFLTPFAGSHCFFITYCIILDLEESVYIHTARSLFELYSSSSLLRISYQLLKQSEKIFCLHCRCVFKLLYSSKLSNTITIHFVPTVYGNDILLYFEV